MAAVTIERLERALALCAYIVELDGPVAAPLFERLERELAAAKACEDVVMRAKALRKNAPWSPAADPPAQGAPRVAYRAAGGLKAIR